MSLLLLLGAGSVAINTYTYQWQDSPDGTTGWANITGATGSSYTIGSGEQTKFLRVVVTATNDGGSSTANSNVLGAVTAATVTRHVAPTIRPSIAPSIAPTVG